MRIGFVRWAAAFAAAGSLVGGFAVGQAAAAGNAAPVVSSGAMTVRYEDVYTVHFTASDPEGAPLTVVTPPVNDDWISCDDGPANDFTCDYSSSRYGDPEPLPTEAFQRTITYSVSDGTTTSTGVWTVTVLPPPVMQIVGRPTVTEGGDALLQLKLSSNTYGSLIVAAHATAVDSPDGNVVSTTPFTIDVADGQTTVNVRIPVADDAIDEPTEYFSVSVDPLDAVPYRFADGGNLVTVLDNDGATPTDRVAPVVAPHRNILVDRTGPRPAWVPYSPPTATDAIDRTLPVLCSPAPLSIMPMGRTQVKCTSTDAAGNTANSAFQVTVRSPKTNGAALPIGGDRRCVASGQYAWIEAEGFTANSQVTVQLQSSTLQVTKLQTVRADRKGRVRLVVRIPSVPAGDSDVVLIGQAGNDDLVRMLPLKVGRAGQKHGGKAFSYLRNRNCD